MTFFPPHLTKCKQKQKEELCIKDKSADVKDAQWYRSASIRRSHGSKTQTIPALWSIRSYFTIIACTEDILWDPSRYSTLINLKVESLFYSSLVITFLIPRWESKEITKWRSHFLLKDSWPMIFSACGVNNPIHTQTHTHTRVNNTPPPPHFFIFCFQQPDFLVFM